MGKLFYGLDQKPASFSESFAIAIQHVLGMFSGTVAVPLLLVTIMGINTEQSGLLVSLVLLTFGISTFIQIYFGTKLPIIQGASFVFLGTFIAIIHFIKSSMIYPDPNLLMQYIIGPLYL